MSGGYGAADVRVEGVSVELAGRPVLHGISAVAEAGTITAVVGPNAAGKSTLLRAVAGLVTTSAGGVRIGGEQVDRMAGRTLASRVAWVPARPSVALPFTVREVVAMGRYALTGDPGAIDRAIEAMDLAGVANRRWPELSTGQQQRAALARALAQRDGVGPGVLVLDEPAGPLDLRHAERLGVRLRAIADAGSTVLLAIHDLARAADWSDGAWVLSGGRLAAAGPVTEALSAECIAEVFGVGARWVRLDGREHLVHAASGG